MARVIAPPFGFTPEQQKQYDSLVPDVPEEAVAHLIHEYELRQPGGGSSPGGIHRHGEGRPNLRPGEGERGPSRGRGCSSVRCALPRPSAARRSVTTAGSSGAWWTASSSSARRRPARHASWAAARGTGRLSPSSAGRAAAAPVVAAATMEIPTGGEGEIHARLTATRCEAVLRRAVGDLSWAPA